MLKDIRSIAAYSFSLVLSAPLTGCALDASSSETADDPGSGVVAAAEEAGESREAITGGAPIGSGPGTVQIEYSIPGVGTSWCSGVVIGPHVALTAGHCFDSGLGRAGTHGWVQVKIHYSADGQNWRCVTRNAQLPNGRCSVYDSVWVNRLAASPPRDPVDATLDFAVLTFQYPFINVPRYPLVWVYQREGDAVRQYGVGSEGTIMRYYDDKLDYVGPNHMVIDAGTRRTCGGDSGGPQIMTKYGYDWVVGLHVNSDKVYGDACVAVGDKQRSHRITRARIDWINAATEWTRQYGQPACVNNVILNDREAGFYCY